MKRILIAVLIVLSLVPVLSVVPGPKPGLLTVQQAMAEAGCTSWSNGAWRPGGQSTVYGSGGFSCAAGDPGSRVLQACIVINGTWWDCDTDVYSAATTGTTTAECHGINLGTVYSAYGWYYFKGEDGSEYSGYGYQNWVANCNYGID